MNNYQFQSSFGCLWTTSPKLEDGIMVHFRPNQGGIPYILKWFDTEEEAVTVYSVLKKNPQPNFPQLLPTLTVDEHPGHFLCLKMRGITLENFLSNDINKQKFFEDRKISSLYQNIIIDLIVVSQALMNTPIKFSFDLKDIYILDGIDGYKPHLTITPDCRGNEGQSADMTKIAQLVRTINMKTGYQGSVEMMGFLRALDNYNPKSKWSQQYLSTMPLLWTTIERGLFPCRVWSFVENVKWVKLYDPLYKPFGEMKSIKKVKMEKVPWEEIIDENSTLKDLKGFVDSFVTVQNPVQNICAPILVMTPEDQTRACLNNIRKCLSHFQGLKKKHGFTNPANEEELAACFESAFEGYIWGLYNIIFHCKMSGSLNLLPTNMRLFNMFKELEKEEER